MSERKQESGHACFSTIQIETRVEAYYHPLSLPFDRVLFCLAPRPRRPRSMPNTFMLVFLLSERGMMDTSSPETVRQ